jgi:outer membrane protein assembly factor BamB
MGDVFGREVDNSTPPAELTELAQPLQIEKIWSKNVGDGPEEFFLQLTAAVAGGTVFAAGRTGLVSAHALETGERLWQTNTKRSIGGGPGVGSGVVVVGTREGKVLALSPVTGELLWKAQVTSEVLSPPQAGEGVVVVRTVDGKLFGLSAIDGQRLWIYDRGVPTLTLRGTSTPAIAEGTAVCGFDGGRLVAVSLQTGQPLWETRIALPTGRSELERMVDIDSNIVVVDRTVYVVSFQGRTAAVDLDSGAILWRRDMSSHAGLGVDDKSVYVTDDQSHVWSLDRDSSASVWRQTDLQARQLTSPVRFGNHIIVGDFAGYVHWLRVDDGEIVGRIQVDKDGIIAPPVISGDTAYVYGRGGQLAALRLVASVDP